MRCMVSLDRPQAGSTLFDGRTYPSASSARSPRSGALLDAGYVHPSRTARNHLLAFARSNGIGAGPGRRGAGDRRPHARRHDARSATSRSACASGSAWPWPCWATPAPSCSTSPANGLDPEGIQWVREFLQALAASGPHRVRVQPPAGRDGADGRRPRRDRQGPAHRPDEVASSSPSSTQGWVVVRSPDGEPPRAVCSSRPGRAGRAERRRRAARVRRRARGRSASSPSPTASSSTSSPPTRARSRRPSSRRRRRPRSTGPASALPAAGRCRRRRCTTACRLRRRPARLRRRLRGRVVIDAMRSEWLKLRSVTSTIVLSSRRRRVDRVRHPGSTAVVARRLRRRADRSPSPWPA